jgi:hypothetical protein
MKGRGPYRVLETVGTDSYKIQKIPVLPGVRTKPGKIKKEGAFRLERIPDTVIIHRRMDGTNLRWVQLNNELKPHPLEDNLGFCDFGKYAKAAADARHAFEKVAENDEWEIYDSDDEDGEDDDDNDDDDDGKDKMEIDGDNESIDSLFADDDDYVRLHKKRRVDTLGSTTDRDVVEIVMPKTRVNLKKELCDKIKKSSDKLFVVAYPREGFKLKSWHIVQIAEEDNDWNVSEKSGYYHARFLIGCLTDSKKMHIAQCRHWPEIHEIKRDRETMGAIVPSSPSRAADLLAKRPDWYMWYQDSIPLLEWMVAGPFDFQDSCRIPEKAWKELEEVAKEKEIYIGNLRRQVPLDKPDRRDTNLAGGFAAAHTLVSYRTPKGFTFS